MKKEVVRSANVIEGFELARFVFKNHEAFIISILIDKFSFEIL